MNQGSDESTIVVTGASTGIGRATTLLLASQGFRVFAGVRRDQDASDLRRHSAQIVPLMLDVTDQASIENAATAVRSQCRKGIDGLVNNAGIAVAGPLEIVPLSEWKRQFDVNVFGMVAMTQRFLPMLREGRGRIVNVSSASSSVALPFFGAYASSKSAVERLSDSLRREASAFGVKVIVVCPGQIDTPIFSKAERETQATMESVSATTNYDYAAAMKRFQNLMHQSKKVRRSPERVASVVVKAITRRKPKRRYHVGWDARRLVLVQRFVPEALVDWIIARKLKAANRDLIDPEPGVAAETRK